MTHSFDSKSLINWFEEKKRDLPWRVNLNPYAVWVSEVMLQQTQVSVVIPYFERWMQRFPTVQDLASASLDEVIKSWEGLGYYSRARNLYQGAKTVCELYGGALPEEENELASIKGLGPYTIGAIRSFAFHKKSAAVDGNVIRVISRYFQITDDISKGSTVKNIRNIVTNFLPEEKHWIVNEAMIELGATVCTKTPKCKECPLMSSCQSFRNGLTQEIPYKSTKFISIPLYRSVAIISHDNTFLVRRGEHGEIMHDLHEFPYFETEKEGVSISELSQKIIRSMGFKVEWVKSFDKVSHSFTKYRVQLQPQLFLSKSMPPVSGYSWMTKEELCKIAFSSGHRRIYNKIICSSN